MEILGMRYKDKICWIKKVREVDENGVNEYAIIKVGSGLEFTVKGDGEFKAIN